MGEVLDKLREAQVVRFCVGDYGRWDMPVPDGQCLVVEHCDDYYAAMLTQGELLTLAKEIEELAHGLG